MDTEKVMETNPTPDVKSIHSCTDNEVIRCTYVWTITNFSFLIGQKKENLRSVIFSMGDKNEYQWRLRLYPNGWKSDSGSHVALFLQLVYPARSEVYAKFEFSVLKENGERLVLTTPTLKRFVQGKSFGFNELIERTRLLELLVNDSLKLSVALAVCTDNTTHKTDKPEPISVTAPKDSLRKDLATLYCDQRFSDVTLIAGGKKFRVHKAILSVRSPVFATMFNYDKKEANDNELVIADMQADVFDQLLRFVYVGKARKLEKLSMELYTAADRYGIEELKAQCEKIIIKSTTVDNAVHVLILADRHSSPVLWEHTIDFMKANAVKMVDTFAGIVRDPREIFRIIKRKPRRQFL